MSTPIVLQLQQDALDKDVATSDLLLKAKIVATKLDLKDALEWIELELNGYMALDNARVPEYRWVNGEPRGFNAWNGSWLPIMFMGDGDAQRIISRKALGSPITELEHWLDRPDKTGSLMIPFHPHQIKTLCKALETEPTQMGLFIGLDRIRGVVGAVRNKVLDWSLNLEKAGILGEGLSFSQMERAVAKEKGSTINIQNFSGVIGDVSDRSVVNATQTVTYGAEDLKRVVDQIKEHADGLRLPPAGRTALDGAVVVIEGELSKPKPDKGALRRAFGAVGRIAEGAAGRLVAEGVVGLINKVPWDSIQF